MSLVFVTLIGFSGFAISLLFTRKNGPFNLFKQLRTNGNKTINCSVCLSAVVIAVMWLYIHITVMISQGQVLSLAMTPLYYLCSLGIALLCLSLTGNLDLDQ